MAGIGRTIPSRCRPSSPSTGRSTRVRFLNHGSFGATPRPVLEAQDAWRERMEREPVAFFARDLEPALDEARAALGPSSAPTPTTSPSSRTPPPASTSSRAGLGLEPGDELVLLDHAYPAARNALAAVADAAGARLVTARIPFPDATPGRRACGGPGGREAAHAARHARPRHEPDGARAAGRRDRRRAGGARDRHARRRRPRARDAGRRPRGHRRRVLRPATATSGCARRRAARSSTCGATSRSASGRSSISHGASSPRTDRTRFRLEHDWTGTLDPTPWLTVPAAIAFGARAAPRRLGRAARPWAPLALAARDLVAGALGVRQPAPGRDGRRHGRRAAAAADRAASPPRAHTPTGSTPRCSTPASRSRSRRGPPSRGEDGRGAARARQLRAVRRARRPRGASPRCWPHRRSGRLTDADRSGDARPRPDPPARAWLDEATEAGVALPNAFALATADGNGDAVGPLRPPPRPRRRGPALLHEPRRAARAGTWPSTRGPRRRSGGRHSTARCASPARSGCCPTTSRSPTGARGRGRPAVGDRSAQSREIGSRAELEALVAPSTSATRTDCRCRPRGAATSSIRGRSSSGRAAPTACTTASSELRGHAPIAPPGHRAGARRHRFRRRPSEGRPDDGCRRH